MPSISVELTTSWQQASTLVRTKRLADDLPELLQYSGDRLRITANKDNVGLIYWTSEPSSDDIADDLASGEQEASDSGGRLSLASLHSLFLKADTAGDICNIDIHI